MSPRLIRRELYHMRGVPDSPAKKWVARSKDVARVAPNKKRFAPPLVLRRIPAGRQAGSRSSETLDGEGDGVSAAEAEGSDAALEVAALQFVEQRDEDARAACADGMAERDRAAIHVNFFGIQFELARNGNRGDSESFVQFEKIDIFVAVPTRFGEQLFDGKAVLLFSGNAVFFGDQFAGHAHVEIFVSVPKAVVDH